MQHWTISLLFWRGQSREPMKWEKLSHASLCPDCRVALGWHRKLPAGVVGLLFCRTSNSQLPSPSAVPRGSQPSLAYQAEAAWPCCVEAG